MQENKNFIAQKGPGVSKMVRALALLTETQHGKQAVGRKIWEADDEQARGRHPKNGPEAVLLGECSAGPWRKGCEIRNFRDVHPTEYPPKESLGKAPGPGEISSNRW